MKFCCILPVFNGAGPIERTIDSLLRQTSVVTGEDTLRILVQDGASTDNLAELIAGYDDPRIELRSKPDKGMYDALAQGLEIADGDVCCYLPAGEVYDHGAFSAVSEIFATMENVNWLTGRPVGRNGKHQVTVTYLPHPYRRRYIEIGMYGTRLTVIQQESTFWRSALNRLVDLETLRNCRLAGDYFLWKCFCKEHDLFVVDSIFSSFTVEAGQLSKTEPGGYRREIRSLRRPPTVSERLHALILRQYEKRVPPRRRARNTIRFDYYANRWKHY